MINGLKVYLQDETVRVYTVTDWSLWRREDLLPQADRRTLKRWIDLGWVEARDGADDRVLEIADVTGARIVSHDTFKGRHRAFPWIPGSSDRFLGMEPDGEGVRVVAREIPIYPERVLSSAEEQDLLREAGLYDRERQLRRAPLSRAWLCPEPECPLFSAERADGQPLPVYRNGRVCCPTHRQAMADLGPLVRPLQIKVSVDRKVVDRFQVPPGEPVIVGRELLQRVPPALLEWISRRHAEIRWDGQALTIADLRSSHGVRVKGRRLTPGRPERWNFRDAVALHDRVKLVVSGRHYVFDVGPSSPAEPPAVAFDAQTRQHRDQR